jgi:hypothetical protein
MIKDTVRVPDEYIKATVSLSRKCGVVKGTTGARRWWLLHEIAATERSTRSSNFQFMQKQEGPKVVLDPCGSNSKTVVTPSLFWPQTKRYTD